MAVHDVDVDQVGAAALDGGDRVAERREIGGQNRRRDLQMRLASSAHLERDRLAGRDLETRLRALAQDDAGRDAGIGMIADDRDAEAAVRSTSAARSPLTPIRSGIT